VLFHRFPKTSQTFELGLSKCSGKKKSYQKFVRICEKHFFSDDYYENANEEKKLKEDAVKCFLQIRAYFGYGFFSRKTWTAIIRKFVSFSGMGEISALRSHFGSRKIEQHIYLAFFAAEKRKIGMKMYI